MFSMFALLLGGVGVVVACGTVLLAWALSRAFWIGTHLEPTGQVVGADRVGLRRRVVPAGVGLRQTYGLGTLLFVPILFPAEGRSLTLWSLAERTKDDAERWNVRLFAGTSVVVDDDLHF